MQRLPVPLLLPACGLLCMSALAQAQDSSGFWQRGSSYARGIHSYLQRQLHDSPSSVARFQQPPSHPARLAPAGQAASGANWHRHHHQHRLPIGTAPRWGGQWNLHDTLIGAEASDSLSRAFSFRNVAPYAGIGFDYEHSASGLSFISDVGVAVGKASDRLDANDVLRNRLMAGSLSDAASADAEIARQCKNLDAAPGGINFWPQAYIGISYAF